MFKLKGLYEWKLINIKTGKVDQEGSQWNVVSDRFLDFLFTVVSSGTIYNGYENGMAIQISDSSTVSGVDYRIAGASNNFNILATGSTKTRNVDFSVRSKYTDYNFAPAASPRVIRIIGIKIYWSTYDYFSTPNFVSFIELSTPITQNIDQYLYVKYTIYVSYIRGIGLGTPNNRFIEFSFNNSIFAGNLLTLGTQYSISSSNSNKYYLSYLLEPVELNNVSRRVPYFYESSSEMQSNRGSTFARWFDKTFSVTDIVGPIGSVVFQIANNSTHDSKVQYMQTCYGYSPIKDNVSFVSRVFVHPTGREDQVFSDPSYPASSQGTVTISGTPNNKYSLVMRVRITKTGDASDLVDENVDYTAVDPIADTFTVTQEYTTGDMYQLTTTGVLPSPLVVSTNYYIIKDSTTTIKLASTYANAVAGIAIDITNQGSGVHTLIRQNTGRYRLEIRPYNIIISTLYNLPMAIDYRGYVMPVDLDSTTNTPNNYAEGDYIANTNSTYSNELYSEVGSRMLRGSLKYGEYVYSVQQSRKGLINNICRWRFNTIETSQPLCEFGTSTTKVSSVFASLDGTKMYIATNEGLYEYSFLTPTTPPVLKTITNIISNTINDACIDPVTGYIWTGHDTGLCKIDTTTWIATQYTTSGALVGMSSAEAYIYGGQLDVYNGRVLRGGNALLSSDNTTAWVMDDGIGWYRVNSTNICHTCCLRPGTNEVIWQYQNVLRRYAVTITGLNSGSSNQLESQSVSNYPSRVIGHLCYLDYNSPTTFYMLGSGYSTARGLYRYIISTGVTIISDLSLPNYSYPYGFGWLLGALRRNQIYVDEETKTKGIIWSNQFIIPELANTIVPYGWDGTAWVRWDTIDRPIPKAVSHSLPNGLSINFNNATGAPWDQQFVLGDFFSFMYGPCLIKDNLQQMRLKVRSYYCEAAVRENYYYTIPTTGDVAMTIPEKSDPNFRDLDTLDFITEVYEGTTRYTQWTRTGGITFTANASTDILTVNTNISTGTPIEVTSSSTLPSPLQANIVYYAINVSATTIRLASSYDDAIYNNYIDILSTGSGTHTLYRILLASGEYYCLTGGFFVFSSADAGKTLKLTYTYTKFTT